MSFKDKMRVNVRERERERYSLIKRMKKKKKQVVAEQNKITFFLALMNSAHLSIDVHCSNGAKKYRFSSTTGA